MHAPLAENTNAPVRSLAYRPDIDGLRGIAVLLVLAFHFDLPPVSGGFIGVDIFFVISGFLITSLLRGEESLAAPLAVFYNRRIKRLLPMFVVVMAATTVVAATILLPDDFLSYFRSLYFVLLLQSNNFFDREAKDYFAPDAHQLPLLHTWSLSVEWQFYLLFPAIYLLIKPRLTEAGRRITLVVAAAALAGYSAFVAQDSRNAYLLTSARFFELMFGAVVAYMDPARLGLPRRLIVPLCLAGLAALAVLFQSTTAFPGANAILVCLLAAAVVLLGSNDPILCQPWLVHVGRISYSAYLWHWPLVAFLAYLQIEAPLPVRLLFIPAVLLIAHVSYRTVEGPGRRLPWKLWVSVLLLFVIPILVARGSFLIAAKNLGFPQRLGPELTAIDQVLRPYTRKDALNCVRQKAKGLDLDCSFGKADASQIIYLIGDSHAGNHIWFTNELAREANIKVIARSYGACLMLPGVAHGYRDAEHARLCQAAVAEEYETIRRTAPRFVLLAQRWTHYPVEELAKLEEAVGQIIAAGATPIVIGSVAEDGRNHKDCFYSHIKLRQSYGGECVISQNNAFSAEKQAFLENLFRKVRQKYPGLIYVDLQALQCENGACATTVDGIPIYEDTNHINGFGAATLAGRYLERAGNPFAR